MITVSTLYRTFVAAAAALFMSSITVGAAVVPSQVAGSVASNLNA